MTVADWRRASPGTSRLLVVAAAALFSTGGAAIKGCSLTGWQVACGRSGIAALFLLLVLPSARRGWRTPTFLPAAASATTLLLFVQANKLTTAANSIFLQSTAPLYILLLAPLLLRERARRHDLVLMGALALGMALFFVGTPPTNMTAPDPQRGNLVAAASAVTWALTLMGLRWLGARQRVPGSESPIVAVVQANLLAFLMCLPFALPIGAVGMRDAGVLLYLGVVQIGCAYLCLGAAMHGVPALEVSLLLLVEPVLNPIWAWWVHGEWPGGWALGGGAVILSSTATHAWLSSRGLRRG